jgi:hypothetical protein
MISNMFSRQYYVIRLTNISFTLAHGQRSLPVRWCEDGNGDGGDRGGGGSRGRGDGGNDTKNNGGGGNKKVLYCDK